MIDLATFIVSALLVFGGGVFVILLALVTARHVRVSRRARRRIGWYS